MPNATMLEARRELPTPRLPDALQILAHALPTPRLPLDARGEEIAVICHELRNSLAIVRGAARLLRKSAAGQDAAALIERHAAQMGRHIDDLLHPLSRNGHDHGTPLARVDLCAVAGDAVSAVAPEMRARGHRLSVKLPEQPIVTLADGARLEQAFLNLLINAARYTPDGGEISLTMERENDHVRIRVRDSGIGIEPAMLMRIFGMFVQVRSAPAGNQGERGIGLAVVRNVVERHGGTVMAMSAGLGHGTEFTIDLPLKLAQTESLIIAA